MKYPTNSTELAALSNAQEALNRLSIALNPRSSLPASVAGAASPATAPANFRRCHTYIKWPASPGITPRANFAWKVKDLCKAYNFPTGLAGGGVIGILELGGQWVQSDIDKFCQLNGLPSFQPIDVSVDGANNNSQPDPNADGEVALDIEVAAAAYYYATGKTPIIKVLWAQNDFESFAKAFKKAADEGCDVLSISWGADEARWDIVPGAAQQGETAAADATHRGCVIFAASGDNSSGDSDPGANVDLPSAMPHVIGCGGTTKTPTSEFVWGTPNSSGSGTGGGYSNDFPTQSWQINAPSGPAGTGRMVPDVTADANPNTGYLIVLNGHEIQIGGTSAVAPLYSGLFAAFGKKLGFVNPTLWQNPSAFVDITAGTNGGFNAIPGPDPCSGLGAPNGSAIASLFANGMHKPASNGHGTPVFQNVEKLESFRVPAHANLTSRSGEAATANVSSIVSVASNTFVFRENSNSPGRFLEQSVVVNVPSGAGYFTCIPHVMGAFTTPDFQFLTERPLGQFYVNAGLRGNNLVCTVRLTDANSDDPIYIEVSATLVFFN